MPITLNCACGKVLRIADEHAGKRVKCPACSAIVSSAPPQPAFEVVEDEPKQLATARPVAKARDEDEDDDGYGLTSAEKSADTPKKKPNFRKRADDDDEDDEEESRSRKKKRRSSRSGGADAGKRIGYIVSGGFMIPIGIGLALWGNSGEGRGATKMLIFGICLAIGGLITLVRGITGNIPDDE